MRKTKKKNSKINRTASKKNSIRQILINIGVATFTILIMICIIELTLHKIIPKPYSCNLYDSDKELVFKNRAYLDYHMENSDYNVTYNTNNLGLRSEINKTQEIPKNDLIILTIGDSFTFGAGLNYDETFQKILEAQFSKNNISVTIINAGVNGYGTEQSKIYLERNIKSIHPDIVIYGFYNNDVQDDITYKSMSVENGCLIDSNINPVKKYLYFNSKIYVLLLSFENYLTYEVEPIKNTLYAIRTFLKRINLSEGGKINYLIFYKNEEQHIKDQWPKSLQNIENMNSACKENNCEFILLYFPSKMQIDKEYRLNYLKRNNINETEVDMTKVPKILGNYATNKNITYINLYDKFIEKSIDNKNTEIYFVVDPHFNKEGTQIVSVIIYESLHNSSKIK